MQFHKSRIVLTSFTFFLAFNGIALAVEISSTSPRAKAAADATANDPVRPADAPNPDGANRIILKLREGAQSIVTDGLPPGVVDSISTAIQNAPKLKDVSAAAGNSRVLTLDRPVSDRDIRTIVESIRSNPNVEYAEPDRIMRAQQANDPSFPLQWHYHLPATSVNVVPAWTRAQGNGVVVAVVDTGVRQHEDLKAHLLPGYDFVTDPAFSNDGDGRDNDPTDPGDWCRSDRQPISSWHGTHVAGTIAAVTNNNIGVAGIAFGAKILPVRVLGQCGGSSIDIAAGIMWAAGIPIPGAPDNPNPARVINLSLGGLGPCGQRYGDAINKVRQLGVTVVVAAGNSDIDASGFSPANCDGVISVAATNRQGARANFGGPGRGSNFGSTVKIAAPGGETFQSQTDGVLSTLNSGVRGPEADSYEAYQGTSMAAPHVAAVVALMYEANPSIKPDQVLAILQRTSQPFPRVSTRQCDTTTCGAGIVDANAAVMESLRLVAQAPSPR